ncbi:Stard9, partial [Symbiodinium natans]
EPDTVCVASFYEIHNERIRDLLAPATPKEAPAWQDGGSGGQPRNGRSHSKTTVHFHPRFGAFVAGVEEVPCDDVQEALRLVSFGSQVRTTAATMLNDRSSRSHAIFCLRMERSTSSNSIMLVDLAGREQERLSMCRTERFKELTLINRSLFHLARCVRELAASQVGSGTAGAGNSAQGKDSAQWHHFRNSKLTMVLGHALAGNSHTAVVGTVSPAQISFEDSLATLRFCESVKQVRTKPALPVSHREDVVMELQDEVRRLELELLRARSGRAIVERQLGEAQAMMEHYRCSWKQALEMSGHAELAKVRREAQEAVQLPGVPSFAASGSGNWSPCSGTPGSAEVPLASATGSGSVPVSPAASRKSFWPLAEAGTGGPPAFSGEEAAETVDGDADGCISPSADSPGHLSRTTSAEPRQVPPLPLSLVEAQATKTTTATKPAEASAPRLSSVCSDGSSERHSPCSPSRSVLSRLRSVDSPTGRDARDARNAVCDVDRIFWSPQPDTPSLPSTPRLQTRHIGFQQQQPRILLRSSASAHPSSSSTALPGCRGLPRPSVVYGLTDGSRSTAPQVVSRLLATMAPAELAACPLLSLPAPVPAENELMRACEQSLAEAERSNDWRKQELAVTLRHLRSQLIDINAVAAASRVRRATSPPGSAPSPPAAPPAAAATPSRLMRTAPQTPRSGTRGVHSASLFRALSPPPSTPSNPATPVVQMRPFIPQAPAAPAASATSPPTPRVTSPAPVATVPAGVAATPAFYTAEAAALMEDWRPAPCNRSAAPSVQRMRVEDLPLATVPPPAWVAPLATVPVVSAAPSPVAAVRHAQPVEMFPMRIQESLPASYRPVVSDAPSVPSWSRAAVQTPTPSRQIDSGAWTKAPSAGLSSSSGVSPWLSPKAEDLPCPFQPPDVLASSGSKALCVLPLSLQYLYSDTGQCNDNRCLFVGNVETLWPSSIGMPSHIQDSNVSYRRLRVMAAEIGSGERMGSALAASKKPPVLTGEGGSLKPEIYCLGIPLSCQIELVMRFRHILPRISGESFTRAPPFPVAWLTGGLAGIEGVEKPAMARCHLPSSISSCQVRLTLHITVFSLCARPISIVKLTVHRANCSVLGMKHVANAASQPLYKLNVIVNSPAQPAACCLDVAWTLRRFRETEALLTWDTIHWPWSRVLQRKGELPSLRAGRRDGHGRAWLVELRLQTRDGAVAIPLLSPVHFFRLSKDLRRHLAELETALTCREDCLLKRFQSLLDHPQVDENAPWAEHAEQLRTLLRGGYLSLDSITTREGMLDFFASHRVMARQECLSCCLGIRMTVHYNLFCGTILALGSDEQRCWLQDAQSAGLLGCFMLTETGAGVLSGLVVETVAKWVWLDDEGRGGFELHTPTPSAEKTWISQGLAADYGLVVAQLVTDQRSLGAHVFLVDMRSAGISRECMGEKTTFNALDNARVSFNHVQLPATALLSKLCNVQSRWSGQSWEAEYVFAGSRPPTFIQIAQRLLSGRMCISDSAITYLEGVLGVTKNYAEGRLVWVDKERKMPLADLPYMAKGLESVEAVLLSVASQIARQPESVDLFSVNPSVQQRTSAVCTRCRLLLFFVVVVVVVVVVVLILAAACVTAVVVVVAMVVIVSCDFALVALFGKVGLAVHKALSYGLAEGWLGAFLLLVQSDFAKAIESNSELSRSLVTQIAAAKVEAVDFAIKSLALLRRDVGSFGLMATSPFGSSDILLCHLAVLMPTVSVDVCCRFAEGDSRVLQQMVTRDLVRAHSRFSAVLRLFWRVLKAWLSGAPHGSAKLRYLRDQRLLQLLCVLGKQHWKNRRCGVSKAQAESDAWLQAGELVYDVATLGFASSTCRILELAVIRHGGGALRAAQLHDLDANGAKTHAQQLIHSTVEERCGRSVETDRFMDMCLGKLGFL